MGEVWFLGGLISDNTIISSVNSICSCWNYLYFWNFSLILDAYWCIHRHVRFVLSFTIFSPISMTKTSFRQYWNAYENNLFMIVFRAKVFNANTYIYIIHTLILVAFCLQPLPLLVLSELSQCAGSISTPFSWMYYAFVNERNRKMEIHYPERSDCETWNVFAKIVLESLIKDTCTMCICKMFRLFSCVVCFMPYAAIYIHNRYSTLKRFSHCILYTTVIICRYCFDCYVVSSHNQCI